MAKQDNVVDFGSNELTQDRAVEAAIDEIEKIEAEQAKIDAIMEEAKSKCAPHRDSIAKHKKTCRDDFSIEAKALSLVIAKRRTLRRLQERKTRLEGAAKDQFDLFEEKMPQAA